MTAFGVGDTVDITSKGHGKVIVRRGTVERVIEAGEKPSKNIIKAAGSWRKHESYLVLTSTDPNVRKRAVFNKETDRYFWPRVGNLKLVRRARKK